MKQILPFYKEIVFENKIANLISVSLEHREKVLDGEVSGEFIVSGEYKSHNDTTEIEDFSYKLPFTALIPDDIDVDSVRVDITNFNYEQIEENVLRVDIDFSIEGEEIERDCDIETIVGDDSVADLIDEELSNNIDRIINNDLEEDMKDNEEHDLVRDEVVVTEPEVVLDTQEVIEEKIFNNKKEIVEKEEINEEYVTYHVHVVSNKDSIESIMKMYNVNMELLKEYNDIKELKIGDKVLIPDYKDE